MRPEVVPIPPLCAFATRVQGGSAPTPVSALSLQAQDVDFAPPFNVVDAHGVRDCIEVVGTCGRDVLTLRHRILGGSRRYLPRYGNYRQDLSLDEKKMSSPSTFGNRSRR